MPKAEATNVVATPMITNNTATLRDIRSFDDALAVLAQAGVALVDYAAEYGDGFELLNGVKAKATLVDQTFLILGIKTLDGDYGDGSQFVVIHAVTETGRKVIILDGGSGVCKQALELVARNHSAGVVVKNGLRRSDYTYTDEKGVEAPATTFYLAM